MSYTSTGQVKAYLQGCDALVEEARAALRDVAGDSAQYALALVDLRRATLHARRARLGAYGYPCVHPECRDGLVPTGEADRTKAALTDCPCCGGEGLVLPEEGLRWLDRSTEADPDRRWDEL